MAVITILVWAHHCKLYHLKLYDNYVMSKLAILCTAMGKQLRDKETTVLHVRSTYLPQMVRSLVLTRSMACCTFGRPPLHKKEKKLDG